MYKSVCTYQLYLTVYVHYHQSTVYTLRLVLYVYVNYICIRYQSKYTSALAFFHYYLCSNNKREIQSRKKVCFFLSSMYLVGQNQIDRKKFVPHNMINQYFHIVTYTLGYFQHPGYFCVKSIADSGNWVSSKIRDLVT